MPGPHGGTLTTVGLCAYCEVPTSSSCRLCGRSICPDHRVEGTDLCLGCSGGFTDD